MGSHRDTDHAAILEDLRRRAEIMKDLGKNRIANEKVVEEWTHDAIRVQMLPNDPNGVLRISIGGHDDLKPSEYCNFRGDQGRCIRLLERCLAAMKAHTP